MGCRRRSRARNLVTEVYVGEVNIRLLVCNMSLPYLSLTLSLNLGLHLITLDLYSFAGPRLYMLYHGFTEHTRLRPSSLLVRLPSDERKPCFMPP